MYTVGTVAKSENLYNVGTCVIQCGNLWNVRPFVQCGNCIAQSEKYDVQCWNDININVGIVLYDKKTCIM